MYRVIHSLSRSMAYLGGLMLSALIVLTCVSVLGRGLNGFFHGDWMQGAAPDFANWALSLGLAPINGDFELTEAGVAFAIFAFLPLCHLMGGHASVDIFTSKMSGRVNRVLSALINVIFAFVMVLIAVQLFAGTLSKQRSGQTTQLIEFPIWWAYALCLTGAALAAVVAVYVAWVKLAELRYGKDMLPQEQGPES